MPQAPEESLRTRTFALFTTLAASDSVPVSGAVVTKVSVRAAVKNNRLTATLVPSKLPFARRSVSLKGKVSDWSASANTGTLELTPEEP